MTIAVRNTQSDRMIRRMEGIRVVFQKVVRIIASRGVFVKVESTPPIDAPGWTDGRDIYLNGRLIEEALAGQPTDVQFGDVVLRTKGVIYHELSHILYTPRDDDMTVKTVMSNARTNGFFWWWAFNALEDQRIETLFTATYQPSRKYFEAAVLEWLVKTPEALSKAHLLVRGRVYLPDAIRQEARAVFESQHGSDLTNEVDAIIDAYLKVKFPGNGSLAMKCVTEYVGILMKINPVQDPNQLPPQPTTDNNPTQVPYGDEQHVIKQGKESKAAQDDAQKAAEKASKEPKPKPEDEAEDDGSEGAGEADADKGDDKPSDSKPSKAKASSDAGAEDGGGADEQQSEDGDDGNEGSKDSAGTGSGTSTPGDLNDLAQDLLDQILQSQELADDVQSTVDNIRDVIRGEDGLGAAQQPYAMENAPSEARSAVRKTVTALSQLKLDLEPDKTRRQLSGRINMRRVLGAQAHDVDLFDRWEDDAEDEGGIEAVVLLDMSGSMGGCMTTASVAMWTIKRAMQELNVSTTVLGFSDDWYTLYRPTEKVTRGQFRLYDDIGGTAPYGAIVKAHDILTGSTNPNRVLLTITDGGWATRDEDVEPYMKSLHQQGGTSLLIGLGGSVIAHHGKHCHEFAAEMLSVADVPAAMQAMVAGVMRKAARNRTLA